MNEIKLKKILEPYSLSFNTEDDMFESMIDIDNDEWAS